MAPFEAGWYAGVNLMSILNVAITSRHKFAINEFPLSLTAASQIPNLEIHCNIALQHSLDEAEAIGNASNHLEVLQ